MKQRLIQGLVAACLACLAGLVSAQPPAHSAATALPASPSVTGPSPAATPEQVGLSSERLERIASAIQKSVDEGRMPAASP